MTQYGSFWAVDTKFCFVDLFFHPVYNPIALSLRKGWCLNKAKQNFTITACLFSWSEKKNCHSSRTQNWSFAAKYNYQWAYLLSLCFGLMWESQKDKYKANCCESVVKEKNVRKKSREQKSSYFYFQYLFSIFCYVGLAGSFIVFCFSSS